MNKNFGVVFWVHLVLIIFLWLSPLWADWILIVTGIIALHLYWRIFKGCHLTKLEVGNDEDNTFYFFYLSKYLPDLQKKVVKLWVRYYIPIILILIAYIIQEVYFYTPVISF